MSQPSRPERRNWLKRLMLGFVFAASGGILLDVWRAAGRFTSDRWTEVTPASTVRNPGRYPFPMQKILLLREEGRLAALSLECTHLGCLLNVTDQGFYCPCHGSEFGPNGAVYSGPAKKDLPWHAVKIDGEGIWIHTGERLPRPLWVKL